MFDNEVLNIAIGLIFIFVLYSLLATIILEIISGIINLRATLLVKAVTVMLTDRVKLDLTGKNLLERLWVRLETYFQGRWNSMFCKFDKDTLAYVFFNHPSIKYLSKSSLRSKPSYIEPTNFSATIIKILRGAHYDGSKPQIEQIRSTLYPANAQPVKVSIGLLQALTVEGVIQNETLDQLRQLFVDSQNDADRFKGLLEDWFNEMMARTTGWYKRKTNYILFFIGIVIAFWGNVDTLKIYKLIAHDKTAREQLVAMAAKTTPQLKGVADSDDEIAKEAYSQVSQAINQSGLLLGIGKPTAADTLRLKKLNNTTGKIAQFIRRRPAQNLVQLKLLNDSLSKATDKDKERFSQKIKVFQQAAVIEADVLNKKLIFYQKAVTDQEAAIRFKNWDGDSILGWLITALAISLGSPFWFDILSKIINLRAAGQRPDDPKPVGTGKTADKSTITPNQRIG